MKTVKLCALLVALGGLSAAYGMDVRITNFNLKNDGVSTFSVDVKDPDMMQTMSVTEYEYTVLGKIDLADGKPWEELSVTVGSNLSDIPLNNIKDGKEYRFFKVGVRTQSQVTFYSDIGVVPSPELKNVFVDRPYGSLATTSHPSYTFAGWWSAATTGTQVFPETTVANPENHGLYARWAYLGAPANAVITDSGTVTVPAGVVSPVGAGSLSFSSYTVYASGGRPLPPGFSFNPSTRVITVAAGTTVGRYELYTTVAVSGTVPALLLTSPSFTVDVHQNKQYWFNAGTGSKNEWTNRDHMLKTSENQDSFAYVTGAPIFFVSQNKVMYIKREGVGSEQPAYARTIDTKVSVRAWRDRNTNNNNNILTIKLTGTGLSDVYVMSTNAENPPANTWITATKSVANFPRGGAGGTYTELAFDADFTHVGGNRFQAAWARLDIVWAPPATGITY